MKGREFLRLNKQELCWLTIIVQMLGTCAGVQLATQCV